MSRPVTVIPSGVVRGQKNPLYFGFAVRLRRARKAAGLSLAALARASGSTAPTILALEQDDRCPRVDTAEKLAHALNLAPSLLAFGLDYPDRPAMALSCSGVGKRLREARDIRGLSMRQLEQLADAAGNLVRNTESARSTPTLATIERLAKALNVSPAWLAYGQGPMQSQVRRRVQEEGRSGSAAP